MMHIAMNNVTVNSYAPNVDIVCAATLIMLCRQTVYRGNHTEQNRMDL